MDGAYRTPSPASEASLSPRNGNTTSCALPRPMTPLAKHSLDHWHGLPSPQTPYSRISGPDIDSVKTCDGGIDMTNSKMLSNIAGEIRVSQLLAEKSSSLGKGCNYTTPPDSIPQKHDMFLPLIKTITETNRTGASQPESVAHQETTPLPGSRDGKIGVAHDLDASFSPTTLRRSTRIKKADKNKGRVTAPAVSDQIVVPFKADLIPFEGLPAHQSVDWQLQYPPGGSTHPSYPYPNLDPRLIFQKPFVPVIDGLPDFSKVPKLILPIGWRHVSWCGLLPIAFDPYRQAFKLTPIGPMPLTCEEVHQMGLHSYVPGGKLHPENGLLPQMIVLSDGSDGEVHNWEGIDWVLPYAGNDTLDIISPLSAADGPPGTDSTNSLEDLQTVIASPPHPAADAWDCPDSIVDLEDAWRWLAENEQRQHAEFEPTIGKTWRGTGIHRTTRKIKQPIASLMGLALINTSKNDNQYLVNQNGRDFCPFKSVATPIHVDVTLLKDVEITLFELLSYFPNHLHWRKGADRLVRAGLSASDISNLINMVRRLDGDALRIKGRIHDQLWYEYESPGSRKKIRVVRDEQEKTTSYTTEDWTYTVCELTDYPILGLAHGLEQLPTGSDAGPLTALIKWCRNNRKYETMLSHVPELLKVADISSLIEPSEVGCPDQGVSDRYTEAMKMDRKRILKSAGVMKRAAEGSDGAKMKKRKAA
ncbi:hypothetical protein BKA66DRAFT_573900 [Pyrenochaeta sp. MPI-SDFR-AT-0127]|nr:hypothetical protein BKA66DRAFT_573900 [Pyrenochaeta sp. MPI-SDFR-AT-0127]